MSSPHPPRPEDQLRGRYAVPLPVVRPIPARALVAGLSLMVLSLALFGFFAEYGRKELVPATLVPVGGEARVVAPLTGLVSSLSAQLGHPVAEGTVLAVLQASPRALAPTTSRLAGQPVQAEPADAAPTAGMDVLSPVAGVVSSVAVSASQTVEAGQLLAIVGPRDSGQDVLLRLPPRAVGSVRPGMQVFLRLDAFPFETFGHISAVVRSVDATAADHAADGTPLVRAQAFVVDVPKNVRLQAGMTGQAAVEVDRRTMLAWVLGPLVHNFTD